MACVPTLLSTIEQDVPDLRILLVGGEACPQNLVAQWYRPGRRILNTYGPTEATVTAAMTELQPDKPVTIGVPLPTYSIVILDPHEDKTVPAGEVGEIGIAGIGLALGYINRDDLTTEEVHSRFPAYPEQSIRQNLSHRRCWSNHRERRDRLPRPDRHAGQDPRLSHRAQRNRSGATRPATGRSSRRDDI